MKLFLLTATALITGTLMAACGPKDTNKPPLSEEIIFDDGQTYEEVISEPYTADQIQDEE
jgi:hypothetical protein